MAADVSGFADFDEFEIELDGTTVFARRGGQGAPVVLLHGFPETSALWRDIAPALAAQHTVVCPDLRGYGRSGCPPSSPDHAPYTKRALAGEVVALMSALGHDTFGVVGHDRGGRVAYRAALDSPDHVTALAVLDIVPIEPAWRYADSRLAVGFWPWSLLAQEPPLPETLLAAAPDAVIDHALSAEWGTPADVFDDAVRAEYAAQLRDPAHVHAICEEYRAAAGPDREHDCADLAAGRHITCPTLALWSASGPVGTWYTEHGGPLAVWREYAPGVLGEGVPGGHFFPEEHPADTAGRLARFLAGAGLSP